MKYGIYLDVFFVTNLVPDFLALLFAGLLRKRRLRIGRIALGAVFASAVTVALFLLLRNLLLYQLLLYLLIQPLALRIAWNPRGVKKFVSDYVTVYLLLWLLGGFLTWSGGLMGDGQGSWFWFWLLLGCIGLAALVRTLEKRKEGQYVYEVLLETGEEHLRLKGFLDTGNLLHDPFTGSPVHIIEEGILSKEAIHTRLIPYHSVGLEEGLLPVVTLKGMYLSRSEGRKPQTPVFIEKPVIGLSKEKLFQNKEYQMLLNAKSL